MIRIKTAIVFVVPTTLEAEAGGSLEPREARPAWRIHGKPPIKNYKQLRIINRKQIYWQGLPS